MKQIRTATIITGSFLLGMMIFSPLTTPVFAERDAITSSNTLHDAKSQFTALEKEIENMQRAMEELNASIASNEKELEETKLNIQEIQNGIVAKQSSIALLEEKIEKRQEIIKNRIIAMQEQPKRTLVAEVLLHSTSITNLLERMHAVTALFKSDNDMLKVQKHDQFKLK
ncbi:hypothetical protein [Bacillus sp. 165]|uniref:coiled-coil domain-containing protein n=1 Tax=Bacillus sp. 165 TaxID=1529117 RepID=UPI001ADC2340|nr:hypothetical protein [Bacillus sp. 165]MBO9129199.1 hypothetical protein [Bacillus sp. 165]